MTSANVTSSSSLLRAGYWLPPLPMGWDDHDPAGCCRCRPPASASCPCPKQQPRRRRLILSLPPSLQPPREKTTVVFCFAAALVVDVRRGRARLDARRQPWRPVASRAVRVPQGQAVAHSLATWRIFRLRSCCYATLLLFPSFVCLD